ncbi:MAG: oligosaccharide flippase family protein, partial [Paludibacteraceae bacterium]|nr:oligosaccharide flippase family protein [Paludibacteraceae bacterium]
MQNLLRSDIVKNAGKLLSANVVAQAVALLIYPFLTRIYAPEDFGLLSFFLNIGNLIILVSTMEYQYAVLLAKEHRHAVAAVRLSALLSVAWLVVLCLLLPFREHFAAWFHIEENTDCLWLLPLFVAGGAWWNILNMYLTRKKAFGRLSGYKLANGLLAPAGKLAFGFLGATSFGLIIATVIASLCSLLLTIGTRLGRWWKNLWQADQAAMREVAVEYKKFPLFSLPRALVNTLGIAVLPLVLTPAFGLKELGFFSMAVTLAFTPISLIVNSFQQVLFQKVTEKVNGRQSVLPALRQFTLRTLLVVAPFFVLLYFPLPWLTGWLLGDEWLVT